MARVEGHRAQRAGVDVSGAQRNFALTAPSPLA
jgi:hypothetical protein